MRAVILTVSLVILTADALNNGLARTPPMGWLSWERFRCTMDCDTYPDDCISEKLFMDMADMMARDGYREAGYEYVIIDDCWLAKTRDANGRLQPDPKRFPSGIKALADYIHNRGLKFGIYEDFGTTTCEGFPGSEYYLQIDAQTFADWTVDYFKFDGCYADPRQYDDAYPVMGFWLNKTGRPMVYTTAWPKYQETSGMKPNYPRVAEYCNTWRNYEDVDDSWDSIVTIINYYGANKNHFLEVAGPGNFNDPDMLVIGNFGLSYEQERSQMAIWCILTAPMIMSVDLRNIRAQSRALLLNKWALAINQDSLGSQGYLVAKRGNIQVWTKSILPKVSWAFAFLNMGNAVPTAFSIQLSDFGLKNPSGYNVTEVFDNAYIGVYKPTSTIARRVNPNGVFFGKAIAL